MEKYLNKNELELLLLVRYHRAQLESKRKKQGTLQPNDILVIKYLDEAEGFIASIVKTQVQLEEAKQKSLNVIYLDKKPSNSLDQMRLLDSLTSQIEKQKEKDGNLTEELEQYYAELKQQSEVIRHLVNTEKDSGSKKAAL